MEFCTVDELMQACAADKQPSVASTIGAYRSIESDVAYFSMPITTGRLLYRTLTKYGVRSARDLPPGVLVAEVIKPNIAAGIEAAQRIKAQVEHPLIVPAVFDASALKWSQTEYMCVWLTLIDEKVQEMRMRSGWQYSTGCIAEYVRGKHIHYGHSTRGKQQYLMIRDEAGQVVTVERAYDLVATATLDLANRGFAISGFKEQLDLLHDLAAYRDACPDRDFAAPELESVHAKTQRIIEKGVYVREKLALMRAA